ncbi:YopX protein [Streptococcus pneumoniae]|nr:YopX protein [Streptococcus pneumoniae]VLU68958.1 YopX protein [Streptococcus pneumoniae]VMJ58399.1 YopX protein [Streptococcus pneumoniae]
MKPKFRAYDGGSLNRMYQPDEVMVGNGDIWIINEDSVAGEWIVNNDLHLMQSTGILDKNSQEIFEGDIIIINAHACIVSFGEYTYFEDADTEVTEVGFYLSYLNVSPATYSPFEKFFWEKCQVIGNIHENELDLIMYEAWKFNKELEE